MSDNRPDEAELIMRGYRCGYCGSIPGEPCQSKARRKGGAVRWLSWSHSSRFYAAQDEGRLPLPEDKP